MWKTEGLKQALNKYKFGTAFGGARRDEEKSRAKERIFLSFRSASLGSKGAASGCDHSIMFAKIKAKKFVFSIHRLDRVDIWQYIKNEGIKIVPLYFAEFRPTVERDGLILMVDDERFPLMVGEEPIMRSIRFRTWAVIH